MLTSLLHEFPQLVISGDGSTLVYTKNVTPGIPRGDLIAIDRVSGARGSIASGSVLVPRPEGCPDPGPNGCLTPVPLREAGPVMVGRGISNDGQTVLVHACCDHLYAVRGGGATQLDPPLPSNEKSGVFFMDISADGGTVLFTHGGTPVPAIPGYRPPVRMYARSLGGGGATLEENLSDADVFWDGPVALSGDGRLAFYQVTKRSGAPLSDHPTLARPMIVRDTTTGQLVRDPTTGTAEIVTATTDGVTLRCGLTGYRLATSMDGSVLAYTTEDFEDTLDVIPWDRNLYFDAHVIDRSIPIRAPITSAPCPFLPTSGSTR